MEIYPGKSMHLHKSEWNLRKIFHKAHVWLAAMTSLVAEPINGFSDSKQAVLMWKGKQKHAKPSPSNQNQHFVGQSNIFCCPLLQQQCAIVHKLFRNRSNNKNDKLMFRYLAKCTVDLCFNTSQQWFSSSSSSLRLFEELCGIGKWTMSWEKLKRKKNDFLVWFPVNRLPCKMAINICSGFFNSIFGYDGVAEGNPTKVIRHLFSIIFHHLIIYIVWYVHKSNWFAVFMGAIFGGRKIEWRMSSSFFPIFCHVVTTTFLLWIDFHAILSFKIDFFHKKNQIFCHNLPHFQLNSLNIQ